MSTRQRGECSLFKEEKNRHVKCEAFPVKYFETRSKNSPVYHIFRENLAHEITIFRRFNVIIGAKRHCRARCELVLLPKGRGKLVMLLRVYRRLYYACRIAFG